MNAYTEINGEPMASSAKFLKELIRDEMGWNGMMVTDWSEIRNQHDWHKVAETPIDAVEISMRETTIDMSMVPNTMRAWQVRSERHLCHFRQTFGHFLGSFSAQMCASRTAWARSLQLRTLSSRI